MAKTSKIAQLFMWSAILQGALAAVVTLVIFILGSIFLVPTPASLIAFGSAGIWLLVGYVMYIVMIIALGVTSLFYNHIETDLGKKLDRLSTILAQIHLLFMNVGMFGATMLLMYSGYLGGAGLLPVASGGGGLTPFQVHEQILGQFPTPIVAFIIITLIGALAGGISFFRALMKRK